MLYKKVLRNEPDIINLTKKDIDSIMIGNPIRPYIMTSDSDIMPSIDFYYIPLTLNGNIVAIMTLHKNANGRYNTTLGVDFIEELNKLNRSEAYRILDIDGNIIAVGNDTKWKIEL